MDMTMILITIVCFGVLGVLIYLAPAIKRWADSKNVPLNSILDNADTFTKIAANIAKQMFPQNANVIDTVTVAAEKAVCYAEQLYKSGQCESNERKTKAIEFVKMALKDANIPIDEEKEKYIAAVIESAVYILPKN